MIFGSFLTIILQVYIRSDGGGSPRRPAVLGVRIMTQFGIHYQIQSLPSRVPLRNNLGLRLYLAIFDLSCPNTDTLSHQVKPYQVWQLSHIAFFFRLYKLDHKDLFSMLLSGWTPSHFSKAQYARFAQFTISNICIHTCTHCCTLVVALPVQTWCRLQRPGAALTLVLWKSSSCLAEIPIFLCPPVLIRVQHLAPGSLQAQN